jgi:regulatory protein
LSEEQGDPEQRAKDICLRLLQFRARTRAELAQALGRKGIEQGVIERVLGRLDEVGLIDDKGFAEVWVRSRHTYEGLGRRALAAELRRKGVDDAVTAEAVAAVDYDAEEERARQLVRKKLRTMSGADGSVQVRRLVGMLARKGYSQGMSYRVVREELREAGQDTAVIDDVMLE